VIGAVAFGLVVTVGTCAFLAGQRAWTEPSGVVYASQLPPATRQKLDEQGLLEAGEQLIVYHDGSFSLDQSELVLLTTERAIYAKGATRASMRLAEIVSIDHHEEPLIGDVIEIASVSGQRLRLEIALFNGGTTFMNVLEDEVRKRNANVRVRRGSAP
jgi:hypothetical protein